MCVCVCVCVREREKREREAVGRNQRRSVHEREKIDQKNGRRKKKKK